MQIQNANSHKFCAVVILICLAVIVYLAVGCVSPPTTVTHTTTSTKPSINVYFSPRGGCANAILSEINNAKREILVHAYRLTYEPFITALGNAVNRGVAVVIVVDTDGDKKSIDKIWEDLLQPYQHDYSPIWVDNKEKPYNHNKVMIIDKNTIITGSFNFSKNAEDKNAENLLIIKGYPELVSQYIADFEKHKDHSK